MIQSIVMPVLNGEKWIEDCFHSIINQSFSGTMEVSIFNDGSTVSVVVFHMMHF